MENNRPEADNILAARRALKQTRSTAKSLGHLGQAGRATGVTLRDDVQQDEDALDNIESYWQAAVASPDRPEREDEADFTLSSPALRARISLAAAEASAEISHDSMTNSPSTPPPLTPKHVDMSLAPLQDEPTQEFLFVRRSARTRARALSEAPPIERHYDSAPEAGDEDEDQPPAFADDDSYEGCGREIGEHEHTEPQPVEDKFDDTSESENAGVQQSGHSDAPPDEDPSAEAQPGPAPEAAVTRQRARSTITAQRRKTRRFEAELAQLPLSEGEDSGEGGTRRSRRRRFAPLEFWKNERVVYGRRDSTARLHLPAVLDVVRAPPTPDRSVPAAKRRETIAKATQRALRTAGFRESDRVSVACFDVDTQETASKEVMLNVDKVPSLVLDNGAFVMKPTVCEDNFVHLGVLVLPKSATKPNKNSGRNALAFHVIQGAVKATLGQASFIAAAGAHFLVPRGNQYELENVAPCETRLFYCHARDKSIE